MESRRSVPLSALRSFYTTEQKKHNSDNNVPEGGEFQWRADQPSNLPAAAVLPIVTSQLLDRSLIAAMTGPDGGFQVAREWKEKDNCKTLVCGTHVFIDKWKEIPHKRAHGKTISLYDTNPISGRTSGDPIADAFVVKVRSNSAFVAVADGVNWGEAPRRAARFAINAVYEHLERNIFLAGPDTRTIRTTRDAASLLFAAFRQAHLDIVAQTTGCSTLCVGLLLPVYLGDRHYQIFSELSPNNLFNDNDGANSRHCRAFVVASVGDSQAFILRDGMDAVEITGWVPAGNSGDTAGDCVALERDFRDAGGALGGVYESGEPELQNMMCAVVLCSPRDVIILGTDGLTDNFDPVVMRIAIPHSPNIDFVDDQEHSDNLDVTLMPSSTPAKSVLPISRVLPWSSQRSIAPPIELPFWPKPPPPPPMPPSTLPPKQHLFDVYSNEISACSLNYTDQLELTWPERRRYAAKEMTRLFYELERIGTGPPSAADFAEELLKHAIRVTAQKRQFLEAPGTTKLKAQFSRYMRNIGSGNGKPTSPDASVTSAGGSSFHELEQRRAWVMDSLKRLPGKLDHATVVVLHVSEN